MASRILCRTDDRSFDLLLGPAAHITGIASPNQCRCQRRPRHMGVAMAGMLVPALTTLPTGLWEAVFVGLAGWFSWQSVRFLARHLGQGGRARSSPRLALPDASGHVVRHALHVLGALTGGRSDEFGRDVHGGCDRGHGELRGVASVLPDRPQCVGGVASGQAQLVFFEGAGFGRCRQEQRGQWEAAAEPDFRTDDARRTNVTAVTEAPMESERTTGPSWPLASKWPVISPCASRWVTCSS